MGGCPFTPPSIFAIHLHLRLRKHLDTGVAAHRVGESFVLIHGHLAVVQGGVAGFSGGGVGWGGEGG